MMPAACATGDFQHYSSSTPLVHSIEPRIIDTDVFRVTGFMLTFAEHLGFTALVSVPLLGVGLLGLGSVGMFYCYWVFLDLMLAIGHCNWEFVPAWTFRAFPFLRNLVYTPT